MSAFSHTVLSAWITDPATQEALSFEAERAALARFEIALATAQAELGLIPPKAAAQIAEALPALPLDQDRLRGGMIRDGVIVPDLVAQWREGLGKAGQHLHHGATSQDVIDTALMLRLGPLLDLYATRIDTAREALADLDALFGARDLMAVTRMRDALPIKVSDRIATWDAGLADAARALRAARMADLAVQLAGPVGTLTHLAPHGPGLRRRMAELLELTDPGGSWHTERSRLTRIAATLSGTLTAAGKIGADMGLMAQDGVGAIALEGGSSSSMAHKVNPVAAELLVALARYAAPLLGGMAQASLHPTERSGIAWTSEWLILPDLLNAAGAGTMALLRLLDGVKQIGHAR